MIDGEGGGRTKRKLNEKLFCVCCLGNSVDRHSITEISIKILKSEFRTVYNPVVTRFTSLCFELVLRGAELVRSPVGEKFSARCGIGANLES